MPMQPSPRLETVKAASSAPRVRGVIVMSSTQLLRAHSKSSRVRHPLQLALVDADLVVDRPQVAGDLGQLALDAVTVVLEQFEPLGLVPLAGTHELGIAAYVAHRHARRAKSGDHRDPGQVTVGVAPV